MNIYPPFWDSTITVYNKYQDSQTGIIKWYRTTLTKCFWKHTQDTVSIGGTELSTDHIICRIPKNDKFLEKYRWVEIPNDQMQDFFTLGVGDIVVKGVAADEIDEQEAGKRSNDFLKKYKSLQGCFVVSQVEINTGAGRDSEHYYVKGA